jgi:hypothetical protein
MGTEREGEDGMKGGGWRVEGGGWKAEGKSVFGSPYKINPNYIFHSRNVFFSLIQGTASRWKKISSSSVHVPKQEIKTCYLQEGQRKERRKDIS